MVLVVGGTGDLGGRVVRRLRAAGEPVRCLVRPGTDPEPLRRLGVTIVPGDLCDAASIRDICRLGEPVVATATAIGRILAGARRPTIDAVDRAGMLRLVDAAEQAQAERFVYLSFAGAGHSLWLPA